MKKNSKYIQKKEFEKSTLAMIQENFQNVSVVKKFHNIFEGNDLPLG